LPFPGEDDASTVSPQQLIARRHTAEHASRTLCCTPDLSSLAGLCRCYADGPRFAGTARLARRPYSARRHAKERDAAPVWRPFGLTIVIGAGVHVAQRTRRHVVHPDETVIAARAGARDP